MTCRLLPMGLALAVCPGQLFAQGFSGKLGAKTTVVLERKLPAAVNLPGTAFSVKTSAAKAQDPCQQSAADRLQSTIETALIRFNTQLQPDPLKPDSTITVRILTCNAAAKEEFSTALTGKNKGTQQPSGVKVTGELTAAYQARTRAGASIDAESIDVKYEHEFDNTLAAVSETRKIIGKIPLPGKKHQEEAEDEPRTQDDVIMLLVSRMTDRIAARLVNTNERVEAYLARGAPFEENNRYAEAKQWTKFVENLETMPMLPNPADDAYRLYNIGVGNEALGYKAETPAAAKRYFEKAVIAYRQAGEANPHEKYFIEPVNRIEIALEHYKKLEPPPAPAKPAPTKKGPGK